MWFELLKSISHFIWRTFYTPKSAPISNMANEKKMNKTKAICLFAYLYVFKKKLYISS